jgi:hypothetical protein
MPRIMPALRYFSVPSTVVGAVALRNEALNCTPWGAVVDPRAARLHELVGRDHRGMAVTRSTRPASTSLSALGFGGCFIGPEDDARGPPSEAKIGWLKVTTVYILGRCMSLA